MKHDGMDHWIVQSQDINLTVEYEENFKFDPIIHDDCLECQHSGSRALPIIDDCCLPSPGG
jgi:hypothetical protein